MSQVQPPTSHYLRAVCPQYYAKQERENLLECDDDASVGAAWRNERRGARRTTSNSLRREDYHGPEAAATSRAAARLVRESGGSGWQACVLRLRLRDDAGREIGSFLRLEMPIGPRGESSVARAPRPSRLDHRSRREEAMLQEALEQSRLEYERTLRDDVPRSRETGSPAANDAAEASVSSLTAATDSPPGPIPPEASEEGAAAWQADTASPLNDDAAEGAGVAPTDEGGLEVIYSSESDGGCVGEGGGNGGGEDEARDHLGGCEVMEEQAGGMSQYGRPLSEVFAWATRAGGSRRSDARRGRGAVGAAAQQQHHDGAGHHGAAGSQSRGATQRGGRYCALRGLSRSPPRRRSRSRQRRHSRSPPRRRSRSPPRRRSRSPPRRQSRSRDRGRSSPRGRSRERVRPITSNHDAAGPPKQAAASRRWPPSTIPASTPAGPLCFQWVTKISIKTKK